jgi:pre-rRNA-processing protein TSR4
MSSHYIAITHNRPQLTITIQKWLDESAPAPGDFANCKVCNSPMLLLLELHGDLPDHFPTDERRLYLFGCPRKPCNRKPGSIRAFRATRKVTVGSGKPQKQDEPQPEEQPTPTQPKQDLGASLFGSTNLTSTVSSNPNPFSTSSVQEPAGTNPFATPVPAGAPAEKTPSTTALATTFAEKVRISSPPPSAPTKATPESATVTPWPAQSAFPPPYKNFYLDAEYETLSRPSTPEVPANVQIEPMEEEGAAGPELKDTFESDLDRDFMKFSMRLEHNPEQVLRYEFRGSPLLYSTGDAVGARLLGNNAAGGKITTLPAGSIPACEYCGSQRVFELQLVPHAITMLEEGRPGVGLGKDDAGMEWGTIIMGVCGRDCAPMELGVIGWREEWAGVQWEETK